MSGGRGRDCGRSAVDVCEAPDARRGDSVGKTPEEASAMQGVAAAQGQRQSPPPGRRNTGACPARQGPPLHTRIGTRAKKAHRRTQARPHTHTSQEFHHRLLPHFLHTRTLIFQVHLLQQCPQGGTQRHSSRQAQALVPAEAEAAVLPLRATMIQQQQQPRQQQGLLLPMAWDLPRPLPRKRSPRSSPRAMADLPQTRGEKATRRLSMSLSM